MSSRSTILRAAAGVAVPTPSRKYTTLSIGSTRGLSSFSSSRIIVTVAVARAAAVSVAITLKVCRGVVSLSRGSSVVIRAPVPLSRRIVNCVCGGSRLRVISSRGVSGSVKLMYVKSRLVPNCSEISRLYTLGLNIGGISSMFTTVINI